MARKIICLKDNPELFLRRNRDVRVDLAEWTPQGNALWSLCLYNKFVRCGDTPKRLSSFISQAIAKQFWKEAEARGWKCAK